MSGQAKDPYHFPFKLYAMLEYASSEDSEHGPPAVAWTENGQAFAIRDREAFLKRVVPKFFKQAKFRSFTRQLNLWGFARVCHQSETWKHKHFVCGRGERLRSIKRMEDKSNRTETRPEINDRRRTAGTAKKSVSPANCVISPEGHADRSIAADSPESFFPNSLSVPFGPAAQRFISRAGSADKSNTTISPSTSFLNGVALPIPHIPKAKVVPTSHAVRPLVKDFRPTIRPEAKAASVPPTVAQLSRNETGRGRCRFRVSPTAVKSDFSFVGGGSRRKDAPGDATGGDMLCLLSRIFKSEETACSDDVHLPSITGRGARGFHDPLSF